jgi:hypothetical protein
MPRRVPDPGQEPPLSQRPLHAYKGSTAYRVAQAVNLLKEEAIADAVRRGPWTPLERWAAVSGISAVRLLRAAGLSRSEAGDVLACRTLPTIAAALRIAELTGGALPVEAWLDSQLGFIDAFILKKRGHGFEENAERNAAIKRELRRAAHGPNAVQGEADPGAARGD